MGFETLSLTFCELKQLLRVLSRLVFHNIWLAIVVAIVPLLINCNDCCNPLLWDPLTLAQSISWVTEFFGKAQNREMRGFAGREKRPQSGVLGTANWQPAS